MVCAPAPPLPDWMNGFRTLVGLSAGRTDLHKGVTGARAPSTTAVATRLEFRSGALCRLSPGARGLNTAPPVTKKPGCTTIPIWLGSAMLTKYRR
jgi:hypothetical protein